MHFDMMPNVVSVLGWLPNPPPRNVSWLLLHLPDTQVMKPKRLKVYARSELISTKLPIVKDLIEID